MSTFPPLPEKITRGLKFIVSVVLLAILVYVGIFVVIRQQQSQADQKLALGQDALKSIIKGENAGTGATPSAPVVEETYTNPSYGFHFTYTSDWTVHELNKEIIYLNHVGDSNSADRTVFVFLYDIGKPFDTTIVPAAKEGCMADGANQRLRCTDLVSQQPVKSAQGFTGSVFVLKEDLQSLSGSTWTTVNTVNRTFFALDVPELKAKSPYSAIVVTAGRNVKENTLVSEIGNSLSFK